MDEYMEQWQQHLVKCMRCGTCRSVCPVFQVVNSENATARGKVRMIEAVIEGKLQLTQELQQRMSKCLLCKACVQGCPAGVKTDELFLSARRKLAEKNGVPLVKKLAFTGLTYRRLFDLGLRAGALFQNLVFKDSSDGRGKLPRIPVPAAGLNARRLIPPLATTPLHARLATVNKVEHPKARVAFFAGCMLKYVYPDAGEAIVAILRENNVEVVFPADQCCCGTPAFTSGDFTVGQYLAECNVAILADPSYDAIITGCASCGSALKHEYGQVIADPAVKEKWKSIAGKVYDVAQYLVKFGYSTDFGEVKAKVTYHDPCHLVRGMGVAAEPRQILKAIPGLEFVEMPNANKCCGAGGTFSLSHYEISRQINDEKLDKAEKTGADTLATGCSACRMHINDGLSLRQSGMKVRHTAEIIAEAYRTKKGGAGDATANS